MSAPRQISFKQFVVIVLNFVHQQRESVHTFGEDNDLVPQVRSLLADAGQQLQRFEGAEKHVSQLSGHIRLADPMASTMSSGESFTSTDHPSLPMVTSVIAFV
jgi:hypothetical protein